MGRISDEFLKFRESNKKMLIAFLTAGFPDIKLTKDIILFFQDSGIGMIELGVPFSDPIADGVTIQTSSQIALKNRTSLPKVLELVSKLNLKIPIILLSYFNPIYKFGIEDFAKSSRDVGVNGVIIPDIIPEESKELRKKFLDNAIDLIFLLAPTTSYERRKMIIRQTTAFIYVVSLMGVTGAREKLPTFLNNFLSTLDKETTKPLALGFGISKPSQLIGIKRFIDGIVIGSAFIDIILKSPKKKIFLNLKKFITPFLDVLNK